MSNLQNVPADRRCNAKTRAGTPCKNWGRFSSGRCRMHGGKSYGGYASPGLKHGWYSTYFPFWFWPGGSGETRALEAPRGSRVGTPNGGAAGA